MNAPAQRATMTVFRIEMFNTQEQMSATLKELLPVLHELWQKGPNKNYPFDPDMGILVDMVAKGYRRFITGRRDGEIVCLQHWIVTPDPQCKGRTIAFMGGIYKRVPDACDTVDFIRFGIQTMRGFGANTILLPAYAQAKGLKEKIEQAGGKLVEYILEV